MGEITDITETESKNNSKSLPKIPTGIHTKKLEIIRSASFHHLDAAQSDKMRTSLCKSPKTVQGMNREQTIKTNDIQNQSRNIKQVQFNSPTPSMPQNYA